uniref:Zinc metalloproteinase n=1 Tax=Haemonchus contortus TaxID=6289 RepID=A0A7I5EAA2_HAECO
MISKQSRYVALVFMLMLILDGGLALTDSARASLMKTLRGVDPEQRRERLKSLQAVDVVTSPPGTSSNTDENDLIETNKASFPGGGSIVEKNRIAGISDYLYEGDINLTEEQLAALESELRNGRTRQKRQAAKTYSIWTNKKVFYYFDAGFGEPKKALVKKALAYLTARTCVTFVENATAMHRIRVFSGEGCNSFVGMVGGEQDLSLGEGCDTMGIVAHEFIHALGVYHMQSRHDRDSFITADLTNVPDESKQNYIKLTTMNSINYTPYEYGSVMHYDAQSFATTGTSMKAKNAKYLRTMGSHMISFYDISIINTLYNCNGQFTSKGAACVNGGKRNPKNCNACICPAGYGGALCSLRPAGCGAVLTASATWKSKKVVLGNATNPNFRDTYMMCNDWIKAPAGKKVQVQVTVMKGVVCSYGCWTQGIEFKTLANKLMTNPRSCCAGQLKQVITSTLNPTPVINYNSYLQSEITYLYRYI